MSRWRGARGDTGTPSGGEERGRRAGLWDPILQEEPGAGSSHTCPSECRGCLVAQGPGASPLPPVGGVPIWPRVPGRCGPSAGPSALASRPFPPLLHGGAVPTGVRGTRPRGPQAAPLPAASVVRSPPPPPPPGACGQRAGPGGPARGQGAPRRPSSLGPAAAWPAAGRWQTRRNAAPGAPVMWFFIVGGLTVPCGCQLPGARIRGRALGGGSWWAQRAGQSRWGPGLSPPLGPSGPQLSGLCSSRSQVGALHRTQGTDPCRAPPRRGTARGGAAPPEHVPSSGQRQSLRLGIPVP